MSKRKNRLFGLGLIAGAALGYWLNTEQGKATRRQVQQQAGELGQKTSEVIGDNTEKLKSQLTKVIEDGRHLVEQLAGQAKQVVSNTAEQVDETVDDTSSSLQKGMKRAKQKIKNAAV